MNEREDVPTTTTTTTTTITITAASKVASYRRERT
jgi:hypothetical protein